MKRLEVYDSVTTEEGSEVVLYQRDDGYFVIRVDGWELMSSRAHGSEEALATLALEALDARPSPRVLVGGLGMGFTVRAALAALDARGGGGRVAVAEILPAVVTWNRGPLAHLAGHALDDRRVTVEEHDVALLLEGPKPWDVVLLDVDNGPEALTLASNRRLYTGRGIERLHRALTPGGVLGVWCADPEPDFARALGYAGFEVKSHRTGASPGGKGPRHTILVARRVR
jgi:spermidine synthase